MIRKFPMKEDFLTTEEMSKYINITPGGWAVKRFKKDGPPFIKIKNDIRYMWGDVLHWIDKESSKKAALYKRNELLFKRFKEVKTEMPSMSNKKVAHIIAHEFNLTGGTVHVYIYNYIKDKKEENKNKELPILDLKNEAPPSLTTPLNISKKSSFGELGSAILSILNLKNSIHNKNT